MLALKPSLTHGEIILFTTLEKYIYALLFLFNSSTHPRRLDFLLPVKKMDINTPTFLDSGTAAREEHGQFNPLI